MKNRVIAFGLLWCIGAGIVPVAAYAGENESKNVAIGATVVSAYLLSQRRTRGAGIAGAVGSAYLWKKYGDSRSARRNRELARERTSRRQAAYWKARYQAKHRYAVRTKRSNGQSRRVAHAR